MKIALYISNRVHCRWPKEYIDEFISKALARGHRVFGVEDGAEENDSILSDCDVFVGVPCEYSEMAREKGKRVVHLLGPTLQGEGVRSPIVCAGCLDKLTDQVDCFFGDEICMNEITPNDVLEVLCA